MCALCSCSYNTIHTDLNASRSSIDCTLHSASESACIMQLLNSTSDFETYQIFAD